MTLPQAASKSARRSRRGAVTLEWVLLATIIILGTVGGVAAVRNALILEYQEMIETICQMSVVD
jgi:Flp pilus assembly protein TadG